MTTQSERHATSLFGKYAGNPAVNYQRFFVPDIGEPFARTVLTAAVLEEGDSVLDVACGTGVAARMAAEQVGPAGSVVGVDLNPAMLEVARTVDSAGADIEWQRAAAEDLTFDDDTFDAVLCSLGLQFFTDKAAALLEMNRVLMAGGRLSVGTVGPTPPLFEAIDTVLADHLGLAASAFIGAVFSVHDSDRLASLLDHAGFSQIEIDERPIQLRLAPPADFVWQYITSTPLAALAAELDEAESMALQEAASEACEPFTDGGSLVMAPNTLLATGRK